MRHCPINPRCCFSSPCRCTGDSYFSQILLCFVDLGNFIRPLFSIIMCCSIFETIALGLAADKSSVFYMATSIGLHQPAESIALLIAFLKTNMPTRTIVSWLSLFSLVGPLGVTIGIFIKKVSAPLTQAIIVALTAGTFLYLGATEVCKYRHAVCVLLFHIFLGGGA